METPRRGRGGVVAPVGLAAVASEHTRRILLERCFPGARPAIEVIPLGVASGREESVPETEVEQTLRVHGLRRPYLLVLGATTPRHDRWSTRRTVAGNHAGSSALH